MKTLRWLFLMALMIGWLGALPAYASFHIMQIEQVIGGVNGDPNAQAIQLRMRTTFQNQVQNARLIAHDAAGLNPIVVCDMTTPVPNQGTGLHVLIATSSFTSFCSTAPDFIMTPIPASYLAAGSLTFEQDPPSPIIYWRLSWGGASYTGPGTGAAGTNDADGIFSPPFPTALPSSSTQALQFKFAATALSTNNANDYQITAGAATFTNNGGASAPVVPAGGCSISPGIDLFVTPSNSSTRQDFSSMPIPAGFFDPGSDPFTGNVVLRGSPIDGASPLGPTDTVVKRDATAIIPTPTSPPATIPIEIVALSLVSAQPITVTYNSGQNPEPWDVHVCLSGSRPQQTGTLQITPDGCNCPGGGTFHSQLPVLPRLIFQRISPPATRVLDFGDLAIPPIQFQANGHWEQFIAGSFNPVQVPAGLTVDHDCNSSTPKVGPLPASGNFFLGVRPLVCDSVACGPAVDQVGRLTVEAALNAAHGIVPATPCAGDADGDGVCNDVDNCPNTFNPDQADRDDDGIGDACDNCPTAKNACQEDDDHNGVGNVCQTASVDDPIADRVLLSPPSPNPSRGSLTFSVNLPRDAHATVAVYDMRGRRVRSVVDAQLGPGYHHFRWAGALPSGAYILRLEADGVTQSRKFSFIR